MQCQQRLYQTADRTKLVHEGDPKAAFLYATPGDEIPDNAAERYGLKEGKLPGKAASAGGGKQKDAPPNKERKPGQNKGGGQKKDEARQPAERPLTDIAGIGPATAKVLGGAGVTSVAQVAAVDLAQVPTIEGLPPAWDWVKAIDAAKALLDAKGGDA